MKNDNAEIVATEKSNSAIPAFTLSSSDRRSLEDFEVLSMFADISFLFLLDFQMLSIDACFLFPELWSGEDLSAVQRSSEVSKNWKLNDCVHKSEKWLA